MPGTCPGTFCSNGLHLSSQLVIPVGKDSPQKAVRLPVHRPPPTVWQRTLLASHLIDECDLIFPEGPLFLYATVDVEDKPMRPRRASWGSSSG